MAQPGLNDALGQLVGVLREAFEGPQRWSYFADIGLLPTLNGIRPDEASRSLAGTSVAAHAYHVAFGLDASAAWIRGDHTPRNWDESWKVGPLDDASWTQLQQRLRKGYEVLRQTIESQGGSSAEALGGAVGALAHIAYHLGAIRQKIACLRSF